MAVFNESLMLMDELRLPCIGAHSLSLIKRSDLSAGSSRAVRTSTLRAWQGNVLALQRLVSRLRFEQYRTGQACPGFGEGPRITASPSRTARVACDAAAVLAQVVPFFCRCFSTQRMLAG